MRASATLLQRARVNLDLTDYKAAREDADQVAALDPPRTDDAALIAAEANRQLWDFPASLAACDRFTSSSPLRVAVCEANQALVHILTEDWEKAAAAVDLALVSWAECPTALLASASLAFCRDHDAERADVLLAQAIALAPEDPSLRILRAQVRTKLRCFDDALRDCDEAIKRCLWLEPRVARIQAKLARDRWDYVSGKNPPLDVDIAAVLTLRPSPTTAAEWSSDRRRCIASALRNDFDEALKGLDEALRCCDKALAIQPKAVPGLLVRAGVQVDRRDFPAAVDDCRKVLDLCPENARALYLLGQVSLRKNELDDALEAFVRSELAEPHFVLPIRGRSDVHRLRKEYGKVIELCDYGLKIEPDQPALYFNRAFAKSQTGELDGALRDYDKSIEFDSSNPSAFNNRGLLWASKKGAAKKEFETATEDFTEAIRRGPRAAGTSIATALPRIVSSAASMMPTTTSAPPRRSTPRRRRAATLNRGSRPAAVVSPTRKRGTLLASSLPH